MCARAHAWMRACTFVYVGYTYLCYSLFRAFGELLKTQQRYVVGVFTEYTYIYVYLYISYHSLRNCLTEMVDLVKEDPEVLTLYSTCVCVCVRARARVHFAFYF